MWVLMRLMVAKAVSRTLLCYAPFMTDTWLIPCSLCSKTPVWSARSFVGAIYRKFCMLPFQSAAIILIAAVVLPDSTPVLTME